MCAIFGYISRKPEGGMPIDTIKSIATRNVERGPHAFGFAWVTADGRLRSYKQSGKITDHLGLLAMARDARLLIGHTRYATHGSPENNLNNHPHPIDGGWLVHNGVVWNYRDLLKERQLLPVTDCDSEVIALLHESLKGDDLLKRYVRAVAATQGQLATLCLWRDRVIAARAGNPLFTSGDSTGKYFATVAESLPGQAVEMPNNTAAEFTFNKTGAIHGVMHSITGRAKAQQVVRRGAYFGG